MIRSARPRVVTGAKVTSHGAGMLPKNGPVESHVSGAPTPNRVVGRTAIPELFTAIASALPSPLTSAKYVPWSPQNGPDENGSSAPKAVPVLRRNVIPLAVTVIRSARPSPVTSATAVGGAPLKFGIQSSS